MKIKVDSRRRIVIPTLFAKELGIKENSVVTAELNDGKMAISKSDEIDLKRYINDLLKEDITFETERYLKDILKRI